jgi:hypothetical protein
MFHFQALAYSWIASEHPCSNYIYFKNACATCTCTKPSSHTNIPLLKNSTHALRYFTLNLIKDIITTKCGCSSLVFVH